MQALVHYMKEQAKQQDIRDRDRAVQEKVQQLQQEMLMHLVFLCLINQTLESKIQDDSLDPSSAEYRTKARELLQNYFTN